MGFEPTPTFVDQNAHFIEVKSVSLESGALDRSAILTCYMKQKLLHFFPLFFQVELLAAFHVPLFSNTHHLSQVIESSLVMIFQAFFTIPKKHFSVQ